MKKTKGVFFYETPCSIYMCLFPRTYSSQPFTYGSKKFTGSVTYAQLCTTAIKISTFTT